MAFPALHACSRQYQRNIADRGVRATKRMFSSPATRKTTTAIIWRVMTYCAAAKCNTCRIKKKSADAISALLSKPGRRAAPRHLPR